MYISDKDRQRVEEALKKAESATSGEIVPLVTESSDLYPHADMAGGVIGEALALAAGAWIVPEFGYVRALILLVAGFAAGFALVRFTPAIKRFLIGGKIIETEVRQRALQAFIEHGLTETRDRTGVLILVSLMERRVQVLADAGIHKKVQDGTWEEVVRLVLEGLRHRSLADGLCAGIERCGEILAQNFPIKPDDTNELSDKLIVE